jgi:hypothetical protein
MALWRYGIDLMLACRRACKRQKAGFLELDEINYTHLMLCYITDIANEWITKNQLILFKKFLND